MEQSVSGIADMEAATRWSCGVVIEQGTERCQGGGFDSSPGPPRLRKPEPAVVQGSG